jgi:hypothetical protein
MHGGDIRNGRNDPCIVRIECDDLSITQVANHQQMTLRIATFVIETRRASRHRNVRNVLKRESRGGSLVRCRRDVIRQKHHDRHTQQRRVDKRAKAPKRS